MSCMLETKKIGKQVVGLTGSRHVSSHDLKTTSEEWRAWLKLVRSKVIEPQIYNVLAKLEGDNRIYFKIDILGHELTALLDSGATHNIIGGDSWEILKNYATLKQKSINSCTLANGGSCECLGVVELPARLENKIKILEFLVVPSIKQELILGIDFWRSMEIIPDVVNNSWTFKTELGEIVTQKKTFRLNC